MSANGQKCFSPPRATSAAPPRSGARLRYQKCTPQFFMTLAWGWICPALEFFWSFPQEEFAKICLKCMKNAHFSKWPTFWGAGLMKSYLKYVCNHNSNVYTAFREYRKNYIWVIWSSLESFATCKLSKLVYSLLAYNLHNWFIKNVLRNLVSYRIGAELVLVRNFSNHSPRRSSQECA